MKAQATGGSTRSLAADLDAEVWQVKPWRARLIRALLLLAPILISAAAVFLLDRSLRPDGLGLRIAWIALMMMFAFGISKGVEQVSRGMLPIDRLYRMSLAFPDRAPERYKMALKQQSARSLQRDLLGGKLSQPEAAEKLLALVETLSKHDRATRGHSERVRAYSDVIGEELKLPTADRQKLHWSALTHDLGKLSVPPEILNSPNAPTDDEWQVLRGHPGAGAAYVDALRPWLGDWVLAASEHHERWDGDGYPLGIAGEEISLAGRIVAVADAYDVMTSARSYKKPLDKAVARAELANNAGTQFDPVVVRAFLNAGVDYSPARLGPLASLQALLPQAGAVVATASTAAAVGTSSLVASLSPAPFDASEVALQTPTSIPNVEISANPDAVTPGSTVTVTVAPQATPDRLADVAPTNSPADSSTDGSSTDGLESSDGSASTGGSDSTPSAGGTGSDVAAGRETLSAPSGSDPSANTPTVTPEPAASTAPSLGGGVATSPTLAETNPDVERTTPATAPASTPTTTPSTTQRPPTTSPVTTVPANTAAPTTTTTSPPQTTPTTAPASPRTTTPATTPTTTPATTVPTTPEPAGQIVSLSEGAELLTELPADLSKGNADLQQAGTSWVFLEQENFIVPAAGLVANQVDPGFYNGSFLFQRVIPEGTVACSYFVHADSATTLEEQLGGVFETEGEILGVIYGRWELGLSSFLEQPVVNYTQPGTTDDAAPETQHSSDRYGTGYLGVKDVIAITPNQVWWNFHLWSGDIDQMRIITSSC